MEDKKTKAAVEGEVAEADAEASRGESVRTELERDGQGDSDASDEETVHDSSKEDVDADDAPASAVKGETRKKKPRAVRPYPKPTQVVGQSMPRRTGEPR